MKNSCPVCEIKFRHYYLYLRHIRDMAEKENILIKEKMLKYSPHTSIFEKILSKCDERVAKFK